MSSSKMALPMSRIIEFLHIIDYILGLTLQLFKKIDGYMVKDLKNNSKFPDNPDETKQLTDFSEQGGLPDESYGTKIFGYFKAPQDGAYTFYISEFFLFIFIAKVNCHHGLSIVHYNSGSSSHFFTKALMCFLVLIYTIH